MSNQKFVGGGLKFKFKRGGIKKSIRKMEIQGGKVTLKPLRGKREDVEEEEDKIELIREEDYDHRTTAEKKFDLIRAGREAERKKKTNTRSHREKIENFNKELAALPEHFDIPRVGPG
jgi:protein FAM32A